MGKARTRTPLRLVAVLQEGKLDTSELVDMVDMTCLSPCDGLPKFQVQHHYIPTLSKPHVCVTRVIRIVLRIHPRKTSLASACPLTCRGEDLCRLIIESKATIARSWVGNPRSPTSFLALQPITGHIEARGTSGFADSHHIIHF